MIKNLLSGYLFEIIRAIKIYSQDSNDILTPSHLFYFDSGAFLATQDI